MKQHHYTVQIDWTGNDGDGTKTYRSYRRDHVVTSAGKPPIPASSDPAFRGDGSRYNPEELVVAALSSCHMLWYLHVCAVNQIIVTGYSDAASGVMEESGDGGGAFVEVTLRPTVVVAAGTDHAKASALHDEAHRFCFVARSVKFPVKIEPVIAAG